MIRFLSHIYYTYYSIDKFFCRFSTDRYSKPKNRYVPIIADSLIETTICGFVFGALRIVLDLVGLICCFPPNVNRIVSCIMIAIGVFFFALLWKKVADTKTYEYYFSEFDNDANYDHFAWNLISFFVFVIAVALLLYSIFTTFPL